VSLHAEPELKAHGYAIYPLLKIGLTKNFTGVLEQMLTGAILDRVLNQVSYAPWITRVHDVDILTDEAYRKSWCKRNLDLFLHGAVPPRP